MAKPWRRALRRDASRPALERGPVLFVAFFRLAAICRFEARRYLDDLSKCLSEEYLNHMNHL